MTIVFRVDASREIGTGHVARCLNLAQVLSERGESIRFVTRALPGHAGDWIAGQGYVVELLQPPRSSPPRSAIAHGHWLGVSPEQDAEETICAIGRDRINWLVVDHYALDIEWHRRLRPWADRLMVIDDLADRPHDCDCLVDQNALPSTQRDYAGLVPAGCRRLLGPDYALLSSEYAKAHEVLPTREAPVRRVLVFFGGSDSHDLTSRALEAIAGIEFADVRFDVVIGASHPHREVVMAAARSLTNVRPQSPLVSLAPLMAAADLALGAGGVSMWERCCLGLPALVVTVAENQVEGTSAAAAAGLVKWIGHHSTVKSAAIASALQDALLDSLLESTSRRCFEAVDGRGVSRVATIMVGDRGGRLRLRRATPTDERRLLTWANDREARAQALTTGAIDPADHRRWFRQRLRDLAGCRIYIAETVDGVEVGQTRFDRQGPNWKISYAIDTSLRGQGFGKAMLSEALDLLTAEFPGASFSADVKAANHASRRVFVQLGFVVDDPNADVLAYKAHRRVV